MNVFLSLGLGFLLGYMGLVKEKMLKVNQRLQTVWLVLLIFIMGMSIGMDSQILKSLPTLGGKALLFTLACSAGSVFVVFLISHFFFDKEGRDS